MLNANANMLTLTHVFLWGGGVYQLMDPFERWRNNLRNSLSAVLLVTGRGRSYRPGVAHEHQEIIGRNVSSDAGVGRETAVLMSCNHVDKRWKNSDILQSLCCNHALRRTVTISRADGEQSRAAGTAHTDTPDV